MECMSGRKGRGWWERRRSPPLSPLVDIQDSLGVRVQYSGTPQWIILQGRRSEVMGGGVLAQNTTRAWVRASFFLHTKCTYLLRGGHGTALELYSCSQTFLGKPLT